MNEICPLRKQERTKKLRKLEDQKSEKEKFIANQDKTERQLMDNLELRDYEAKVKRGQQEVG